MFKASLAIIVVAILGVLGYAAISPDHFRIERTASIAAPPEKVFPLINDFQQWPAWSPWEKIDPTLKRSYSGPQAGVGAVYAWQGNNEVGTGRMEITGSEPASRVEIKLDFQMPFEAHNTAEFILSPENGGTRLTWTMYGPSPYTHRLMQVFFDMDDMVGSRFDQGLANLKAAAEQ
ncbi:SRPBCC family protein [Metapseudomonas furukawaii]|uniref:SRPBCC family protein n=1 Tax=Metapseudomonas furukawaii TaxID=1149133 RepID=UPI00227AD17D|nr:SRPBCC family protein [Pseudomonas furukawaii]WAG80465.1 SRPBCC family protein [Pseudomonas furukawaii]